MTNAIWGIVIAMALMFGIAFYRSTHQRQPAAHPRGSIRQQTQTACASATVYRPKAVR